MRTPTVGGNWKMNTTAASARSLAAEVAASCKGSKAEVSVFVPFPYLAIAAEALAGSAIKLGAQDAYHQPDGAFTGEVSLTMLKDCSVSTLLVGHSERRHVIGESDSLINAKVLAGLEAGLEVVLCVGETLDQRERGQTDAINAGQLALGLAGVSAEQMSRVTVAYEPVWAIGTGKTASAQDAQNAHKAIRAMVADVLFAGQVAQGLRIQYGGSVKPANAAELFGQPDIDGGLIGGASLKAADFAAIVAAAS